MSDRLTSIQEAAGVLKGGGVVAFTGAGISAESGIPTFRDPGGLWERFDPGEFGTWEGLMSLVLSRPDDLAAFLSELRRSIGDARPGPAHVALATLERAGIINAVITQNVDGLHQDAGTGRVVEVHGSFRRVVCMACGHRESVGRDRFLDDVDRAILALRTAFVPSLAALLPRCSRCGGPARPDFVAFGQALQHFEEAEALARRCRVLLAVGTSGEVFPAATLPETASRAGAVVIEVATGQTDIQADLRLEGRAGAVLPPLVQGALGAAR